MTHNTQLIDIKEKPNGSITFWNRDNGIELIAIPSVSGKFGEYILYQNCRKDLSKFIKNKSELFKFVFRIWGVQ